MIKKIVVHRRMTRAELGALVCSALSEALGDSPVLVGGAAASIYSKGLYLSDDLDIVSYRDRKHLAPVMEELGFQAKDSYWRHPKTDLLVQFVSGPTMIGKKYVKTPRRMRTTAGVLPVISALDSACDRLAWYLQGSAQGLKQCANIVIAQKVSVSKIADWLAGEGWSASEKGRALAALREEIKHQRT